jgi:hypothetical protein
MHLYKVITTIIKEYRVSFLIEDLSNLCLVNKDFTKIFLKVLHWLRVDFTPLQDPSLGYKQQNHIDPYHVEMASVAMVHFSLCFMLGKYTGQHRDVRCTLDAV